MDIGFRRAGFAPQDSYFWAKNEHEVISCKLEADAVASLATATADRELQILHQAAITAQANASALCASKDTDAASATGADHTMLYVSLIGHDDVIRHASYESGSSYIVRYCVWFVG